MSSKAGPHLQEWVTTTVVETTEGPQFTFAIEDPLLRSINSAKHSIDLRDEAHWTFIEMANITPYAPPTKDTAGACKSRVYYVAAVLERSGIVPCNQTGYRSGLIQFAIYMEQKTPHRPWVTVPQEFSPSNPHLVSTRIKTRQGKRPVGSFPHRSGLMKFWILSRKEAVCEYARLLPQWDALLLSNNFP